MNETCLRVPTWWMGSWHSNSTTFAPRPSPMPIRQTPICLRPGMSPVRTGYMTPAMAGVAVEMITVSRPGNWGLQKGPGPSKATKLRFQFGFAWLQSLQHLCPWALLPTAARTLETRLLQSPLFYRSQYCLRLVLTYSGLGETRVGIPALGQIQYLAFIVITISYDDTIQHVSHSSLHIILFLF